MKSVLCATELKQHLSTTLNKLKLLAWFGMALCHTSLYAQFDKYKSNTQFNSSEAQNQANAPTAPNPSGPPSNTPPPNNPNVPDNTSANATGGNVSGQEVPPPPPVEVRNLPERRNEGNRVGQNANDQNSAQTDVFGRGTGIRAVTKAKKDENYVNLNFETAFGPEVVTSFNFPDISLTDLTKQMQKLTGLNLIMDKELKGKISIVASSPITVGDAWRAYMTALEMNGYSLVRTGAFYRIVSTRDIRYTPTKIYTGSFAPNTDNYIMKILPLKNINSTEITRSFRPFLTRYGRLIDIKQTNTIIVQDTGSNINRLSRLIKFIDVPGHEETLQIIPVKHSSAQEIAKLLDQILQRGGGGGNRRVRRNNQQDKSGISKIIAEPRTNMIIAMANADGGRRLKSLIKKLDVEGVSQSSDRIHVYYLNHGDAESLAKTLSSLISGAQAQNRRNRPGGTRSNRSSGPAASIINSEGLFTNEVKVTADKDNNALVVTASSTDYLTLKEVVGKLDIPRDQVYVEGLMMETQVSKARGFGISVVGAYGSGNARKAGFTQGENDGLLSLLTNQITSLGGLFAGVGIGKTIEYDPGNGQTIKINSVNALISAIASNTDTNVLATPQILALDNTEAVFEVGESIPTPRTTTGQNGITTTSLEQQKVGLMLKITPQINKVSRLVKLKIEQKIQDFSERALPDGLAAQGIATVERAASTEVVVRDKDTIAMGGLMRDRDIVAVSKIPLLGDIPVLGWFFKNRRRTVEKVNLIFFLTPRILSDYQRDSSAQMRDLLNRRSGHLKEAIGEDDPFASTVKGLYDKATKQGETTLPTHNTAPEEGPEIDSNGDDMDSPQSEDSEMAPPLDGDVAEHSFEVPDYSAIVQNTDHKKSIQEEE